MERKVQKQLLSVLIIAALTLVFLLAFLESGMWEAYESRGNGDGEDITETNKNTTFEDVPRSQYIDYRINGHWVELTYTGPADSVRWDFGDNMGSEGVETCHKFSGDGSYLIMAYVTYDGDSHTEYLRVYLETHSLLTVEVPKTSLRFSLLSSALIVGGIGGLTLCFLSRWNKGLRDSIFSPMLRGLVGGCLILAGLLAMGVFNPVGG